MPQGIKEPPPIKFTVAIDWERDPTTLAEAFASRLDPDSPRFDRVLYLALGQPISASPVFGVQALPSYLTSYQPSWRFYAQRYVHLQYNGALSSELIRETLRRSDRFGYVGLSNSATFHSAEVPNLVIPADPLWTAQSGLNAPYDSARWPYEQLSFTSAWDYTKGHAIVSVADSGIYIDGNGQVHPDLQKNFKVHLSLSPIDTATFAPSLQDHFSDPQFRGHGTFVAGQIAATPNNGFGGAGGCWNCSLSVVKSQGTLGPAEIGGDLPEAMIVAMGQGAQVINRSGSISEPTGGCNGSSSDPLCVALVKAYERDVAFAASSGNDNINQMDFPSSFFR